jgi:hypothetical protein
MLFGGPAKTMITVQKQAGNWQGVQLPSHYQGGLRTFTV